MEKIPSKNICGYCFQRSVSDGFCKSCGLAVNGLGHGVVLRVGEYIGGQFVVGSMLGSPGGTGVAYLGWDRTLQRKVVIKELFPDGLVQRHPSGRIVETVRPSAEKLFSMQRELFLEEARKLAKLENVDSVVRVSSYFSENNTAYFVMSYIPGRPLSDILISGGKVNAATLMRWIWPLLEGMASVHEVGLIHRDVKPQNLLIDERGRPVLIDFGNAALLTGLTERDSKFDGVSRHYAAPEQYARDNRRMGPWTDIYALGALMYQCLTGCLPTDAQQRLGGDLLSSVDDLAPESPVLLRQVVEKCLEMDETKRPQTIAVLQNLLEPFRPATHHWIQILPDNDFGRRQRAIHAQVQAGVALPRGVNFRAGFCQWFWFLAYRLTGVGVISGLFMVTVVGLVLLCGSVWDVLPLAVLTAWLIGFVPSVLFADAIHYQRVSAVGGSLSLSTEGQRQAAKSALEAEGSPHPWLMISGLLVPVLIFIMTIAFAQHEAEVQLRIERAIALDALREWTAHYMTEHEVPPSDEDLPINLRNKTDGELRLVELKAGQIDAVLAVSGAEGRRIRWRFVNGTWQCEGVDLDHHLIPPNCH